MSIRMALGLMVAALAPPVSAEQDHPAPAVVEQVPMDVVLRLLGLESAGQLTLGGMPARLAEHITLPVDVEVVATVSPRRDEASYDQVKGVSSLPPQELRQALADSLAAHGWTPQRSGAPEVTSGFAVVTGSRDYQAFCGADDASVTIFVAEKSDDDGRVSFSLSHSPARDGEPCEETWAYRFRAGPQWAEDLVPVLEPPEGAGSTPAGGGGSDQYREIRAQVETELSPDLLVNHYGGQLVAGEWIVGQTVALTNLAAAEVSTQTPDGVPVTGFLLAKCGLQRQGFCEVALSFSRQQDER